MSVNENKKQKRISFLDIKIIREDKKTLPHLSTANKVLVKFI